MCFVVNLLKCVQFAIKCLPFWYDTWVGVFAVDAFQRPLAIDEADIAQIKEVFHADGAEKLTEFVLELEYSEASIHNEEFFEGFTLFILAVGEPGKAILNFAPPGNGRFVARLPIDLLHIV